MKRILIMAGVMLVSFAVMAATEVVDGIEWTYTISDGKASVGGGSYDEDRAVPASTTGAITIPTTLGSCPVTSIGAYAFYGCSKLTNVTIPLNVTSIGYSAFRGCSGMTSMMIPSSVTNVGFYAFSDCSGLRDVAVPGWKCEMDFSSVTNLVISEGTTSIKYEAFHYCNGLTSVTIPLSVTNIADLAFSDCSRLKSVVIPSSVTCIGRSAFWCCTGLTNVMIPSSVTSIGSSAFYGCNGLKDVTAPGWKCGMAFSSVTNLVISEGTTNIIDSAFSGCTDLANVTIPSSVTCIGSSAFQGCTGLTSVVIPSSVTNIGNRAFYNCKTLTNVTISPGVKSISDYAFYGCSGLTNVTIPVGVVSIGSYAFYCCNELTNATIPKGMTNISDYAFYSCSKLTSATIPVGVVSIGSYAFYRCNGLTNVTIPESVTNIGDYAFYGCSGLTSVTIPDGVKNIGCSVFCSCTGLANVMIPPSVTNIGVYAFGYCSGMTSVTIADGVTSIGSSAFYGCSGMKNFSVDDRNSNYKSVHGLLLTKDGKTLIAGVNGDVEIPLGVTSVGYGAFLGCNGVTSITIPSSVTSVGASAFSGCTGLKSIVFPADKITVGYKAFSRCTAHVDIAISQITEGSFMEFDGQLSIRIPDGELEIAGSSFENCQTLRYVTIPASVKTVGASAFAGCTRLYDIVFEGDRPSFGDDALSDVEGAHVYVSRGTKGWGEVPGVWRGFQIDYADSKVTVSFHNDDGTVSASSLQYIVGKPYGSLPTAFRGTERFVGWFTEDEGGTLITGFSNATEVVTALYAHWTNGAPYEPEPEPISVENDVEVVFVVPNGQDSMAVATYATNSVYGRLPEARRDGFTFAGWYTSLDGTERVSAFSAVDPNVKTLYARWVEEDASLYAQWEANKYSVSFNANGGDGEMAAQPFLYDQVQPLTGSSFTKLGYAFRGWSTSPDGEIAYSDKASVSNLTAEAGFAVALFAKWEKVIDVATDTIEDWVAYELAPKFKKLGESGSAYRKRFETEYGDDYAVAFFAETGKIGMDGTRLQVWHDYVAGTDPLDKTSQFKATVTMEGGMPVVKWEPALNGEGVKDGVRLYKVLGTKTLGGGWSEVQTGHESDYNFFKVTVEMP